MLPFSRSKFCARRPEFGAALVELVIILPFLLMTSVIVIDLGRWLNMHFNASRIAFEIARYTSGAPGMTTTATPTPMTYDSGTFDCAGNLANICSRTQRLITFYNRGDSQDFQEVATTVQSTIGTGTLNMIQVRVQIPFRSIFSGSLVSVPITSSARTAYLFPPAPTPTPVGP